MEMGFILFTIPGRDTACVENYWLYEVVIQGEGIINYSFVVIQNIESLELFLSSYSNFIVCSVSYFILTVCLR